MYICVKSSLKKGILLLVPLQQNAIFPKLFRVNELRSFKRCVVQDNVSDIRRMIEPFPTKILKYEVMSNISYYTEEGLQKLKDELNHLRDVERPNASQAIADARDKGDLSENAEYDAAKEAQGLLELKISKLEEIVANARLIDESQLDTDKVLVLSTVKLKNQQNGMEMTYTLVSESEADLKAGKISVTSPIGKGLLGKEVGDVAEIEVPNGKLKFDILEISRD